MWHPIEPTDFYQHISHVVVAAGISLARKNGEDDDFPFSVPHSSVRKDGRQGQENLHGYSDGNGALGEGIDLGQT